MSAQPNPYVSVEQYLELERASLDVHHEYIDGHMYATAGGTLGHGALIARTCLMLGIALENRDCVFATDVKVRVRAEGPFFYPDVVVACGSPSPD
jgi:Uma2 family endonuclease